jgi:hypothetical protein
MLAVPGATAVARPFEPAVSLTMAIPRANDVHVANDVRFCFVPSTRVPVAANCWVVPGAMQGGLAGVTAIELTRDVVSGAVPVIPPETALMTVEPMFIVAIASPCVLIVAILVSDEPQVTAVVTFRWLLSANLPVAVNCTVVPGAMLLISDATERDIRGAGAGGFISETLHPANTSSTAYSARTHGRRLICMALFPHSIMKRIALLRRILFRFYHIFCKRRTAIYAVTPATSSLRNRRSAP